MRTRFLGAAAAAVALAYPPVYGDQSRPPIEKRLANIRQLTHGGENAEAYFSRDGRRLIFQSTRQGVPCDQIFTIAVDGTGERRVSTGNGRTTCGYFLPDGARFGAFCGVGTGAVEHLLFEIARGRHRLPAVIVDDLGIDVRRGAKDIQAWPVCRAADFGSHSHVPALARGERSPKFSSHDLFSR